MYLDRPRFLIPMAIVTGTLWGLAIAQLSTSLDHVRPAQPSHVVRQDIGTRPTSGPVLRPTEAVYRPSPTRTTRKPRLKPVRTSQAVESVSPSFSQTPRRSPTPLATVTNDVPATTAPTSDPTHTDETDPGVGSKPEDAPEAASTTETE